jgi:hypothetical protein
MYLLVMLDYANTRKAAVDSRRKLSERLSQSLDELAGLQAKIEQVRRELATVDQILEAIDFLDAAPPLEGEPSGMADHIRRTLQQTTTHLLPTQLRDLLLAAGVTSRSPKNLLIGVHNVLSRLEPRLETKQINGRMAYRWRHEEKHKNLHGGT